MSQIQEIVNVSNVNLYHLMYQPERHEFELVEAIPNSNLRIFREIEDQQSKRHYQIDHQIALIKCKDWFHPLESGKSIVYKIPGANHPFYIFNDASIQTSYSVLAIDSSVDEAQVILFENVIMVYASLLDAPEEWKNVIQQINNYTTSSQSTTGTNEQDVEMQDEDEIGETAPQTTADVIAKHIVTGAEVINSGLTIGTQAANRLVQKGASHLKNTPPAQNPRQIDPRVINGLRNVRKASQTASCVTGACVSAVAKGTCHLGNYLAPHIRRHGTALISNVSGKNDQSSNKICDDIMTVTAGGLQGFATLYNGITNNVISLAKTVADETVDVLEKKYGNDTGTVAHETLYAAGNAALTVNNVKDLGPKSIAKNAIKETGKSAINHKDNSDKENTKK